MEFSAYSVVISLPKRSAWTDDKSKRGWPWIIQWAKNSPAPPPVPIPTLNPDAIQSPFWFGIGPSMGKPSGVQHIGPLLTNLMPASAKAGIRSHNRSKCDAKRSMLGGSSSSLKSFGMPSSDQNSGSDSYIPARRPFASWRTLQDT